jgi:glycosyltransferase involved in cell wall biosynthesis
MIPVLFIAYHFPPIGGAGVQRSQKFVRYLPEQGFLPIVVTGPGPSDDHWTPNDDGLGHEFSADVRVYRADGPVPGANGKLSAKLGRWLASPGDFAQWWTKAGGDVAAQSINGSKLIFATMSPFSSAGFAGNLASRSRIPWIADLRDPWALDEMQIHPSRFHRAIERNRMEHSLSSAAGIIMNTPEATAALHETFPAFKNKPVTTITNGYDEADFSGPVTPRTDGKFRIVHTGYLHTDMGLQVRRRRRVYEMLGGMEPGVDIATRSHLILLKAVDRWLSHTPEIRNDLEITFAGVATGEDKRAVEQSNIADCVRFPGYVSHSESVELIRTADVLFLPMHNLPSGKRSRIVPGKTYEYMATGRPILAAVPNGDARDFLEQSRTALISKPDDVDTMIEHLSRVYDAWKTGTAVVRPNWEYIKTFERARLTRKLAGFFNQVLTGNA